jgi:chromosomal replication initiator protein
MTSADTILHEDEFDRFLAALRRQFGEETYGAWMSDLKAESDSGDSVTISTASPVKCDRLRQRYSHLLKEAWGRANRPISRLHIVLRDRLAADAQRAARIAPPATVNGHGKPALRAEAGSAAKAARAERGEFSLADLVSPCDERATFERFAVDDSNRIACAAARQAIAEATPLALVYLYGRPGVGKTHLLYAIANEHRRLGLPGGCAYLTYNALKSGCVDAVFSSGIYRLQKDLLAQAIVLLDDVHLLAGSDRTQMEIVNLIKAAEGKGPKIVVAGEPAPAKLAQDGISRRLAEQLQGGFSAAMAPGDAALRARVLRIRLEQTNVRCKIRDDAIEFIAANFCNSLRESLGALNQLLLVFGEQEVELGRDAAAQALRAHIGQCRRKPTLEEAIAAAADAFGITVDELKGRGQSRRLVNPRHAFVMVARGELHESFPRIGRALNRDHTTSIASLERGKAIYARDASFRAAVAAIKSAIGLADR